MNCARFIQHPSNKAKFIRWVVYTTNADGRIKYGLYLAFELLQLYLTDTA